MLLPLERDLHWCVQTPNEGIDQIEFKMFGPNVADKNA